MGSTEGIIYDEKMSDSYKVILLGESGVGKTSIIARFYSGKFDPDIIMPLTSQFFRKTIELPNNKSITFDIWNTAGQERYRSLTKIFYKDAKVIILVYDITNKDSFIQLKEYWYEQVKQLGDKDIIFAVVANKNDLYDKRAVNSETGEEFAKSIGAIFMQTSAKENIGIQELIENIGKKILNPDFDFFESEKKKNDYKKQNKKYEKDIKDNIKVKELEKKLKEALVKNKDLENEIKRLKDMINQNNINKENEIKSIKVKENELKIENDKLKKENKKLNEDLFKLNKILSQMQNQNQNNKIDNNEIKKLKDEIIILNNKLIAKDNEINDLKNNIKNNIMIEKPKYNMDEIMVINFVSQDSTVNRGIKCLSTDIFAEVEEKLYKIFDELRNTNNSFIVNARPILRFKKLVENNIKDGDVIQLHFFT